MKQSLFNILLLAIIIGGLVLCVYPTNADELTSTVPVVQPTEVIGMRTESSKTYDNHDGTKGITSFIGVVHYKDDYTDESEQWKDIDTTIVNGRVDKAPYVMSINYTSGIVTIRDKKTNAITTIGLKDIEGKTVSLDKPVEKDNTICFNDVAKDTDIVVEATNGHIRFKRVLRSDEAPKIATFAIHQQGEGIVVTPLARDNYYADVRVDSKLADGLLVETLAKYEVGQLSYPVEIDPSIDVSVSASLDDCYMTYNLSTLVWTYSGTSPYAMAGIYSATDTMRGSGLRFLGVSIPQGSTVTVAYMNVTCAVTWAINTTNTYITGQLGNSDAFSSLSDFQVRRGTIVGGPNDTRHTVAQVAWDSIVPWTLDAVYQSPSIVTVVQEIVNGTWSSGNAMTLFWDDFNARSTALTAFRAGYSYDGSTTKSVKLHVEYTAPVTPRIQTLRCTGFGKDWLLLNGNVTIVGMTQAGFDYGTTTGYGMSAENTYANYTVTSYGYYKYINGLNNATLYHYRANASNATLGWIYGADFAFSTGGDSVEWPWELNIATVNTTRQIYGSNWAFQRFTTNITAHTISSIDLWLTRTGSPGDVVITVQAVGNDWLPYGAALASGTIAGQYTGNINSISSNTTTRYNVKLDQEISVIANTMYAITVKALMGDSSNYIQMANVNTGIYTYGSGYLSTTSGAVWTNTGTSFLFDLWGRSCLQVDNSKVFMSYKDTGDWLFVFLYDNVFPPYYPIQDSKQYFAYQLVDYYNVVKAQTSCTSWGLRPGSIYLSTSTVSTLQWGGEYRIRLVNLRDGTIFMEYPLQAADWLGSDLTLLDSWCLSVAQQIGIFYKTPLVTSVAGRGNVLNQNGGVMFALGIPLLDSLRSNLFQIASPPALTSTGVYPQTMRQAYQPAIMLGPDAYATMVSIGNVFGVDGKTIGFAGLLLMTVVIAGWGFMPGHTIAATIISSIMFILAMLTGLLDLLIGALLLAICVLILIIQGIFRGG
jgi:hypothetical protein